MSKKRRRRRRRWMAGPLGLVPYVLARCSVWVIAGMPLGLCLSLARLGGGIAYHLDWKHYRIARENLDAAYGDSISSEEKDRIILGSYRNLTQNAVEVIHAARLIRPGAEEPYIEVLGAEPVRRVAAEGKGIVFVSGHIGNWELLALAVRKAGMAVHAVATPRRNPWLDDYIVRLRGLLGAEVMMKKGAVRGSVELLREGRVMGMLVDQNQRRGGIFVEFFGREAATVRAAALLSRRTGAPIIPMFDRRLPGILRHRIRFLDPIRPVRTTDAEGDVRRMTEAYTRCLEEAIREAPDQWLWLHRRWRTRPPEEGKVPRTSLAGA